MKRMFMWSVLVLWTGTMGCTTLGFDSAFGQRTAQNNLHRECVSGCMPVCESLYYSEAVLYPQNANTNSCLDDDRCEQCLSDCEDYAE